MKRAAAYLAAVLIPTPAAADMARHVELMQGLRAQTALLRHGVGGHSVDVFVFNGSEHHAYNIQVSCTFSFYGRWYKRTAVVGDLRPKFGLMFYEQDFGFVPFGTEIHGCTPVHVE